MCLGNSFVMLCRAVNYPNIKALCSTADVAHFSDMNAFEILALMSADKDHSISGCSTVHRALRHVGGGSVEVFG